MNRPIRAWALLAAASSALACGTEAAPINPSGSAGTGTAGASASAGMGGAGTSGAAGAASSAAGNGGQSNAAGAGGSAGAAMGGAGGSMAGASGSAGAGGDSNMSPLPKRVLLYHHSTIVLPTVPAQLTLLKNQLMTWGYEVEDSEKPDDINSTNLARFGGVAMINTCFDPFGTGNAGETQTAALTAFVAAGGGLFGTHCASVTFQAAEPPNPYNALIGGRGGHGYFDGKSACRTTAEAHVTTAMLPASFEFNGNLDNADYVAPDTKVLVMCKWSGGDMKDTAVSWYRTPGKGRVFYTNFAKIDADLSDATLGPKHILVGLGWVLGR